MSVSAKTEQDLRKEAKKISATYQNQVYAGLTILIKENLLTDDLKKVFKLSPQNSAAIAESLVLFKNTDGQLGKVIRDYIINNPKYSGNLARGFFKVTQDETFSQDHVIKLMLNIKNPDRLIESFRFLNVNGLDDSKNIINMLEHPEQSAQLAKCFVHLQNANLFAEKNKKKLLTKVKHAEGIEKVLKNTIGLTQDSFELIMQNAAYTNKISQEYRNEPLTLDQLATIFKEYAKPPRKNAR